MGMDFFKDNGIKHELLSHSEIREGGIAGAAQVLNCPKSYIMTTVLYEVAGTPVGIVTGGEAKVDEAAVREALSADSAGKIGPERAEEITGMHKLKISPVTIWKKFDAIWDENIFDYPYIIFTGTGNTESIRVDTREFLRANLKSARVSEKSPAGDAASAYDVLLERGFIDRITDEDLARKVMDDSSVRGYIGFDPTADSLHVGSLVPIMALAHIQRGGMKPIALVGGATALVGDPSGKTEMRKMLTREQIAENLKGITSQLSNYIEFGDEGAMLVNNADWLADLSYIDYLREVGVHFSVNRMLKAECFASRMETAGLSFIEFNYMLMQAYDFVYLAEKYNSLVQLGGSDQWGNICAGKDLGHRAKGSELFGREITKGDKMVGVTFPLLKSASGKKFGKTEGGNVWLDRNRSTVYDFLQFWRNTDDADVRRIMALFTFIPMEDVRRLTSGKTGADLNVAKEITAFAATSLMHGEETAFAAVATAKSQFGGYGDDFIENIVSLGLADEKNVKNFETGKMKASETSSDATGLPTIEVENKKLKEGVLVIHALKELGLVSSNGEAKRMIKQNAVTVDGEPVRAADAVLPEVPSGSEINVKLGKKKHGIIDIK